MASTLTWAQNASLTLYVFKKGLPARSIEVLVDSVVVGATDDKGVIVLDIDPGLHELELRDQDLVVLSQPIIAHEEEVSQWIVNITRGLSSLTDVESSAQAVDGVVVDSGAPVAAGDPGTLSGTLVSAEDGSPVGGARIFISGQSRDIRTDENGRFSVELPSGPYSISILHSGFNTVTRDGIMVSADTELPLELELTPSGSELPEFVVLEPYIAGSLASVLEERRLEQTVANILGSDQISKAGDSDAAGALRRVTGLTLVDGKFIYVRGLGERYSSTLLNGANVPSPDPTRRVVPLDLFPAGIIDTIAVKKGYASDLPGEFGGGTVEIRTRSVPESPFFNVEFSLGYLDGTTGETGLGYAGGSDDWTGRDDGTRRQPQLMANSIADGVKLEPFNRFLGTGYPVERLEMIGESLDQVWDVTPRTIDPDIGFTAAGGYAWDFESGMRLGFQAAFNYDSGWQNIRERRLELTNAGSGELGVINSLRFTTTERTIDLSGFVTVGAELSDNHSVSANVMLLRNTSDKAEIEQGTLRDASGGEVRFTELEWVEREMKATQLMGEHTLSWADGLEVNWQYTEAEASSDAPDTRRYRYDPDTLTPETDDFIFSIRNDSNQRRWSVLDDSSDSWNIDFQYPLDMFDTIDVTVIAGISEVDKARDSSVRRFSYRSRGNLSGSRELRSNPSLEDIITAAAIDPGGWQLEEVTIPTDAYTALQKIDARHAGVDINIGENWRFAGGVRNETSEMDVSTFNLFDPNRGVVLSTLDTSDSFPYFSATWYLGDHQFRAGYGETINRPDFKELSESLFKDPVLGKLVSGNPDLQPAFITHYDVRWDYYFSTDEFISFGVFFKEFENPIERVILASADVDLASFDNARTAENFGFEFELYKKLDFLENRWGWGETWSNFYLNTNYAWIDSEISLADDDAAIQTSDNRPLQGQSPYVLNFQVGYDDLERNINAALVFNVFGERIVDVGIAGAPDIFEQPRESLDLVYSQSFSNWKLKLKLRNLLDPDVELTQGPETVRISKRGREASIGVEYRFD